MNMATPTASMQTIAPRPFEFGDATPNAVGRQAVVSHEGCVVHLEAKSAPRLMWSGEDLLSVKFPAGTRVMYPNPAIPGLADFDAGIRYAVTHPQEMEPLAALLRPGMRVTIALDDISLPLPKMARPDVRESVLRVLLPMLAEKGIEDFHIIIATSFHRRMHEFEIKRAVGADIFRRYYPDRLYNHDGEAPDGCVELGVTDHGEHVRLNRRAAESDLLIYVNINLVPMDGGSKSVGVGLCDYPTLQAHHTPQTILDCDSYFDHTRSAMNRSCDRIGQMINQQLKVFHIETVLNNQMFDPKMAFFTKNEDQYSGVDKVMFSATRHALSVLPRKLKRKILFGVPAPYRPIAVHAGSTLPVHDKTLAYCYAQYCCPMEGQSDVVVYGIPFVSPYNVNSILNPLLVQVMALGYFHNMYRGMPVVKKNGVLIITHPLYDDFSAVHHPSYIEFFHRILPQTRDSFELQRRYEPEFAHRPDYIQKYRTGNAYHGVHPFYMWYWGENGRAHTGRVICVGAESKAAAETMGWAMAKTMDEALEMAESHIGHKPSVTLMHFAPILMADMIGAPQSV
ncbi:MAG TPA: lactate racemase domain-containing protein [Terriglobia bacterium]|nr:lactate racemase domain-containing protein [Terriglobia bacterium]